MFFSPRLTTLLVVLSCWDVRRNITGDSISLGSSSLFPADLTGGLSLITSLILHRFLVRLGGWCRYGSYPVRSLNYFTICPKEDDVFCTRPRPSSAQSGPARLQILQKILEDSRRLGAYSKCNQI